MEILKAGISIALLLVLLISFLCLFYSAARLLSSDEDYFKRVSRKRLQLEARPGIPLADGSTSEHGRKLLRTMFVQSLVLLLIAGIVSFFVLPFTVISS